MTKAYEVTKRYQTKQRNKGLCATGCGNPLKTKWYCESCCRKNSFKNNKKRMKSRLKLQEMGICTVPNCGRKLVLKWTCRECADKINKYSRNHYFKDHSHNKKMKYKHMNRYRFGGLRDIVLERDNNICQICFRDKKPHVHHINENPKDNRMENLITLCFICHIVIERMNRTKPKLLHLFPWLQSQLSP